MAVKAFTKSSGTRSFSNTLFFTTRKFIFFLFCLNHTVLFIVIYSFVFDANVICPTIVLTTQHRRCYSLIHSFLLYAQGRVKKIHQSK